MHFGTLAVTGQIYVNGVLSYTSAYTDYWYAPTATGLRFGARLGGTNFFNGKLGPIASGYTSTTNRWISEIESFNASVTNSGTVNSMSKLDFSTAMWSGVDPGSTTYTLNSTGLNTGSKLSVQYRQARI